MAGFTRERRLTSAIEEVRHMGVLLGLRGVELLQAGFGKDLSHRHDLGRRKRDLDSWKIELVIGERDEGQVARDAPARKTVEVLLHECPRELPGAIRPEV